MDVHRRDRTARTVTIATAIALGLGAAACAGEEPVVTDGGTPTDVVDEPLGEQRSPTGGG